MSCLLNVVTSSASSLVWIKSRRLPVDSALLSILLNTQPKLEKLFFMDGKKKKGNNVFDWIQFAL